jgi:hypothetical protein
MPLSYAPLNIDLGVAARRRLMPGPQMAHPVDTAGQVPALKVYPGSGGVPSGPGGANQGQGDGGGGSGGGVPDPFTGVSPMGLGAATPRWATWAPAAPPVSVADAAHQALQGTKLSADPQLPVAPLGVYTDSQYEAENASLTQQINAAYQDILQQTGYDDPSGNHIMGDIELAGARQERDSLTGLVNAADDVTGQMQQAGTIFSGYHANQRAKAEQPYITALGDLAVNVPKALTRAVDQMTDLTREYAVQRNLLLMQAAQRQAAALQNKTGGGAGGTDPNGAAGTAGALPLPLTPPVTGSEVVPGPTAFTQPAVQQGHFADMTDWLHKHPLWR